MTRTPYGTAPIRRYREMTLALLSALLLANSAASRTPPGTSTIAFQVAPPDSHTWWLGAALPLVCALAVLGLNRLHLRSLTARLNGRFEERLAERTRIAQELHDTLLQGFLSASIQVQVAADCLPADSHVKASLTRALDLMRRGIEESRHAVCGLRSSQRLSTDLPEAFPRIQEETLHCGQSGEPPNFCVFSEGSRKPLHPVIRDEVYRIGREALINAFRHSHAKNIAIEVKYCSNSLRVVVRDDGCGIEPQLLAAGRDGHWGLSGMRERAERIGARLRLWSAPRCGTELELSVPGHFAFHDPKAASRSGREYPQFLEAAR